MKTLKLSVMLALVSAVFGATALSAAHSPRGASNESSKSAKGHCDSKGGACCKKDCKKEKEPRLWTLWAKSAEANRSGVSGLRRRLNCL